MAIGSGELDGKGYKNNEITSVKNGNFLSEAETDFIFAVIGEEFGFKGKYRSDHTSDADGNGVHFYRGKGEGYRGDDHCGVNGGTDRIPELCEHRSGYVYFPKYRTSFAVCKLWPDLADESVYWNGCCTEHSITGKEKLTKEIIHYKEGVWTI